MWWLSLVKLFGGLDISGLAKTAADAYAAKQDAGVKHDEIDADLTARATELAVKEQALNASIIIAEQGNWLTRMARPAIAFPFVLYLWYSVIWDKILGLGTANDLSDKQWSLLYTVCGSYFIGRTVEKVVSTVRNKFGR